MAEATIIENTFKMTTPEDYDKEAISAKRMKREAGSVTGKSVVVLKSSDVIKRDTIVFMPNTIEMAQLKKPERGQFKTNVQISSKMTESDIEKTLMETFPILRRQRFSCAAAVDNRSRLDFHGEPRIWDGPTVKRKIKGNSALYILTEELQQQQHGDQDPKASEQSTLKRSHDQIITNEQSKQSTSDMVPEKMQARLPIGFEKQVEFFAAHGNPLKHLTSFPVVVPGQTQTVVQKNDNLPSTEKQSMQEGLDKLAAMQGFVLVTSQHMSPPVCRPSISTVHSIPNARDVVTMATSSLPPSFPMGTIMVPAGGIVVAQQGPIGNKAVSSMSDHQSLGKAVFHVAKGADVRHTGLQMAPQVMVSSTLTPQMNSLNISNATSRQPQKPVTTEKSVTKRDQNIQTEDTELLQQDHPMTTLAQSSRNLPVEYSYKTASAPQKDLKFKTPDLSRPSRDENTNSPQTIEEGACANAALADRLYHRPAVSSDHETLSSDHTDSGIETTDHTGEDMSQTKETYLGVAMRSLKNKVFELNEADWAEPDTDQAGGLSLLSGVASKIRLAVTEKKSNVHEICPKRSSIRGGSQFFLILNEHLPSDVVQGKAYFGNSGPVSIAKINEFNMTGYIPASHAPGIVTVKVESTSGRYLGETLFEYTDEVQDILRQLVNDSRLQERFFQIWAQGLGNRTNESEKRQTAQTTSNLKTAATERPDMQQFMDTWRIRFLQNKESGNDYFQPAEHYGLRNPGNQVSESDYDSDDEASSSDSSDDGNESCCKGDIVNPNRLFNNDSIEYTDEGEETESIKRQTNTQHMCDTLMRFVIQERVLNSQESTIYETLEHLCHGQEGELNLDQLDSPAVLLKNEADATGTSSDSCGDAQVNSQTSEKSSNPEDTTFIDSKLNSVDFDQSSVADKSRRAEERNGGEAVDLPAFPL